MIELADGTRCAGVVKGKGVATMFLTSSDGVQHEIMLSDALYLPSYKKSCIFSVRAAVKKGVSVNFCPYKCEMKVEGTTFDIQERGKLYYVNSVVNSRQNSVKVLCANHSRIVCFVSLVSAHRRVSACLARLGSSARHGLSRSSRLIGASRLVSAHRRVSACLARLGSSARLGLSRSCHRRVSAFLARFGSSARIGLSRLRNTWQM